MRTGETPGASGDAFSVSTNGPMLRYSALLMPAPVQPFDSRMKLRLLRAGP
jgi:hypothetical protein